MVASRNSFGSLLRYLLYVRSKRRTCVRLNCEACKCLLDFPLRSDVKKHLASVSASTVSQLE